MGEVVFGIRFKDVSSSIIVEAELRYLRLRT